VLSLRHFRLASWRSLSLGGGGRDSGAAHLDLLGPPGWCSGWWPHDGDVAAGGDFVLAILRFGADDGARAIGATDAAAAVEVRGRRRRPPGSNAALRGGLRRALSPTFPAGELAFFIPWRWWPRFRRGAVNNKGKKAIVDQPPLLKPLYEESDSNERLRVSNWIVDRL
jgi:hypothetical protein